MVHVLMIFCLLSITCKVHYRLCRCPNVEVKPDFIISKYLGKWYYYGATRVPDISSITVDYSAGENGTFLSRMETHSQSEFQLPVIIGELRLPNVSVSAKLKLNPMINFHKREADYQVLETDYDSFAVILTCDKSVSNYNRAWILTREENPAAAVIEKANAVFDKNKIVKPSFSLGNPACTVH